MFPSSYSQKMSKYRFRLELSYEEASILTAIGAIGVSALSEDRESMDKAIEALNEFRELFDDFDIAINSTANIMQTLTTRLIQANEDASEDHVPIC